jgi:CRP/FNR family transcriptional regulator
MAVQIEHLQSIPYFAGLGTAELNAIKDFLFEKMAKRGEIVLNEGEPSTAWYFIVSGAVKVFMTSSEGKEQILDIVRPGESFNDVPSLDGGPALASAQAMGPVVLYGINSSSLEFVLKNYPQVSLNVNRILAGKVRQLANLVSDLSFRPVIGRVAKILLQQSTDTLNSKHRLTQQEMAAMAGTAREVVGRSLKALEDEGIVKLERNRLTINDKEALEDMVAAFS